MKINEQKTLRAIFLIRIVIAIFITNIFGIKSTYSQTYSSTTTANCGKCGKTVSSSAKVGDSCPYCGVRWGKENTTTTNSIINSTKNTGINPFAIMPATTPSIVPDIYTSKSIPKSFSYSGDLYESTNVVRNCSMRSAPNNQSDIMIRLTKNSEITITKRKGNWVKVQYLSSEGFDIKWIHGWIHSSNIVE
jgi:endogenous inhibitor of DNA gyrase (YacG/DUF329 family)